MGALVLGGCLWTLVTGTWYHWPLFLLALAAAEWLRKQMT